MGAADKLYNGNIAETFWSTATDGGFVRNYGYKYDNLNRLKDATYQKSGQVTGMYNENLSYDKNGNIMNLSRYGDRDEQYLPIQIDNLGYGYATNSNKLMSVVDNSNNTSGFKDGITTGDDYAYDANGNMTVDKNKNITSIVYNHLNLPTKIVFATGNIVYFYNASGQKVQKVVTENITVTTTDYLGGYQYIKKTASEPVELQFFPTAEGYVKSTPVSGTNTYSYVFNYTDHLGNVRLSYTKDTTTGSLKILEENNYYPFGLKHNSYNVDNFQPEYKYKYNGKELQEELGLNMTAMDWRQYDAAIGKWIAQDPIVHFDVSPFTAFNNNPVYWADPSGLKGSASGYRDGEMVGADGMTGSEWLASERRRFDKMMGGSGIDIGSMTYSTAELREQKEKEKYEYVFPEGELIWNDWNSSSEVFRISNENATHVYYASWLTSKFGKAQGGGIDFTKSNLALDIGGGLYGALQGLTSSQGCWLGNNGKYYSTSWGGNQYTGSRSGALNVARNYKLAGRATVIGSVILGGYATYKGYVADGGKFGYNAQMAAASSTGSIAGGIAGAEAGALLGASVGVWFGGFGAIPGAVIGGVIGGFGFGMAGGYYGGQLGGSAVNYYHNR
jgi:RHS repeat-associated protein